MWILKRLGIYLSLLLAVSFLAACSSSGGDEDTLEPSNVSVTKPDADNDGIPDSEDNCPNTANPGQENTYGDARGDACEQRPPIKDKDKDGIPDDKDNCPNTPNPGQENTYGDARGDACEPIVPPKGPDSDNDGIPDSEDNCPNTPNPGQENTYGDARGDACEPIIEDKDKDGIPDSEDNCPDTPNADQKDTDEDGIGDVCQDTDDDGILDTVDNCINTKNPDQIDSDWDGIGDACDPVFCPQYVDRIIDKGWKKFTSPVPASQIINFNPKAMGAPVGLMITLNGEDVTDKYTVTDASAIAAGADLLAFIQPGTNVLKVTNDTDCTDMQELNADGQEENKIDIAYDILAHTPVEDIVYLTLPAGLEFQFKLGEAPEGLVITFNGKDVTDLADISATGATVKGADLAGFAVDGQNCLVAKVGGEFEALCFKMDKDGPRVVVTKVEIVGDDSRKLPASGDMLLVEGELRDLSASTSVSINGVDAPVNENGGFSLEIDYAETYKVNATDENGHTSELVYLAPTKLIDPSLALKINQTMMDFVMPIVKDMLADFDMKMDPNQWLLSFKGGLCLAAGPTCKVYFTKLHIGGPGTAEPEIDVSFKPLPGDSEGILLDIAVQLPKINMGYVQTSTGWNGGQRQYPFIDLDVDVNDVTMTLQIGMRNGENNQMEIVLDPDTWMSLKLGNMFAKDVKMACGPMGCNGFVSNITRDIINNPPCNPILCIDFNAEIDKLMVDLVPDLAHLMMDAMNKGAASTPGIWSFDLDKDGEPDTEIKTVFAAGAMKADNNGNAEINMGTHFYVEEESLAEGHKGALGSVYNAAPVPAMGTSVNGGQSDLGIAVSANMINQLLLSFYQTAILDSIEIPLTAAQLCEMGDLLTGLPTVGADDPLRIRMELGSVPYMLLDGGSGMAGIQVQLDNVKMWMDHKSPETGEWDVMLGFVADIAANMEMGLNDDNSIKLNLDNVVAMNVLRMLPEGPFQGLPTSVIEGSMGDVMVCLLGPLAEGMEPTEGAPELELDLGTLGAGSMPLPFDLPFTIGTIMRQFTADANDAYLVLAIDLLTEEQIEVSDEEMSIVIKLVDSTVVEEEEPVVEEETPPVTTDPSTPPSKEACDAGASEIPDSGCDIYDAA